MDLFAFTTVKSWLSEPFYFVEVKASKKENSIAKMLRESQKKFIKNYSEKVGILIIMFTPSSERISMKYYEPM